VGTNDDVKGELLKDIVALVNSPRKVEGFIVVGVEEIKGGPHKLLGVKTHLDDHTLQQWVNSKTQRRITFRYEAFTFKSLTFGLICVPIQTRPVYLRADYGRLKAGSVYYRQGSATEIATPEQLIEWGASATPKPQLEVYIEFQVLKRIILGDEEPKFCVFLRNNPLGATARGVVAVIREMPNGLLGCNFEDWEAASSGFGGNAYRLRHSLNPGEMRFIISVGAYELLKTSTDNLKARFRIALFAEDQAPLHFATEFDRTEMSAGVKKRCTVATA
jgi:hypothetical protein